MSTLGRYLHPAVRLAVLAVRYELRIWRSLGVWLLRRSTVPAGARGYGYAGILAPLMIAFTAVSAVELPILHFLLHWEAVRLIVDLLSLWGLLWMVGLLAAIRVHPHYVTDKGIRVRYGFSIDVMVLWEAVASVRAQTRGVERSQTV